jgi:hypothetical protein
LISRIFFNHCSICVLKAAGAAFLGPEHRLGSKQNGKYERFLSLSLRNLNAYLKFKKDLK